MTHQHPQIMRDDRMLPATRWAALFFFFILVPAAEHNAPQHAGA